MAEPIDAADIEDFIHNYQVAALTLADEEIGPRSISELAQEADAQMRASCAAFLAEAGEAIADEIDNHMGYSWGQAGTDFWLTRNGHGAGFWDRGLDKGEWLSDLARGAGGSDVYLGDDGQVHVSTDRPVATVTNGV